MSKLLAFCLAVSFLAGAIFVFPAMSSASPGKDQRMYDKASARLARLVKDRHKKLLRDQWVRSISEFDKIISTYPRSSYAEKAMFKKAEACYGMYRVSRTQPDLDAAIEAYQQYTMKYPGGANVKSSQARLKSLTGVDPAKERKTAAKAKAGDQAVAAAPAEIKPSGVAAAKKIRQKTEPTPPAPDVNSPSPAANPPAANNAAQTPAAAPEEPQSKAMPRVEKAADTAETGERGGLVRMREIRHWSNKGYTRVVMDLDGDVTYKAKRIKNPDRLFFDIRGARIASPLKSGVIEINDGILKTVRASQYNKDTVRVVLDLASLASYAALILPSPPRLVVDVTGKDAPTKETHARRLGHGRFITLRSIDSKVRSTVLEPQAAPQQQPVLQASKQPQVAQRQNASGQQPGEQGTAAEPAQTQPGAGQSAGEPSAAGQPSPEQGQTAQAQAPKAAPPAAQEAAKPLSLAQQMGLCVGTIVIDPGHGGKDTGAIGRNGLLEKDVVLDVGLRLRDILKQELGCKVVLTRDRDVFIDLDARPGIAVQNDADLFISIHANASRNRRARGIETYLLNLTKDRNIMEVAARENMTTMKNMGALDVILKDLILDNKRDESLRLAHAVQANLVKDIQKINGAVIDKGAKQGPFLVLYGASMPSILTEVGFISNPAEESLLGSPKYRQELAQAIYDGIKEYISTTKVAAVNPAP